MTGLLKQHYYRAHVHKLSRAVTEGKWQDRASGGISPFLGICIPFEGRDFRICTIVFFANGTCVWLYYCYMLLALLTTGCHSLLRHHCHVWCWKNLIDTAVLWPTALTITTISQSTSKESLPSLLTTMEHLGHAEVQTHSRCVSKLGILVSVQDAE